MSVTGALGNLGETQETRRITGTGAEAFGLAEITVLGDLELRPVE